MRCACTSRARRSTGSSPRSSAFAPADVTFVSSNRWDVMGATAFGFRAAWVNRGRMPDEYADLAPVRVLSDLGGLAELA